MKANGSKSREASVFLAIAEIIHLGVDGWEDESVATRNRIPG